VVSADETAWFADAGDGVVTAVAVLADEALTDEGWEGGDDSDLSALDVELRIMAAIPTAMATRLTAPMMSRGLFLLFAAAALAVLRPAVASCVSSTATATTG
jgi:hypothetical protein